MDQPSFDPSGAGNGRMPISHPYPPTYHHSPSPAPASSSSTSTPIGRGQGQIPARMRPGAEQEYMMDYQRRRDQRQQDQHQYQPQPQPQTSYQYGYQSQPESYTQNPPMYPSDPSDPYHPTPSAGRLRSPSESSVRNVSKEAQSTGALATGYPEGWTKEDEEAEREFLSKGMINWGEIKSWRFWIRKEWWFYYLGITLLGVLVCLMVLYHDQIVDWLTPVANWMKDLPGGWAIPIGVFFVISFPPLFGHEIVAILCGAVWGLWIGFGITAAGTFIGEVGNFYAFKFCLRSRAEKYERTNLNYACMAHVVREGGFFIIFAARLSAIPGHFTTAVFSTCGMNVWIFMIACILTLPKQLIVVYLGVIFEDKDTSSKNKIISDSVLAVGFLITIGAAWYIWKKMHQARVVVWRKRRMEAAARGLVLNPVTGSQSRKRASYKEWDGTAHNDPERGAGEGDEDARSPMIRHQSYQNPYDITYQPTDNMSIYHVDASAPTQDRENKAQQHTYRTAAPDPSLHVYVPTQTYGDSRTTSPAQPSPSQGAQAVQFMYAQHAQQPQQAEARFPEARSTGVGVRREKSTAPTVHSQDSFADQADFPVPLPLKGHAHSGAPGQAYANGYEIEYGAAR